jgi:hypothetical protein
LTTPAYRLNDEVKMSNSSLNFAPVSGVGALASFTDNLQCRGLFWGHTRHRELRHLFVILRSGNGLKSAYTEGFCAGDETFLVRESSGILGKTMAAHADWSCV